MHELALMESLVEAVCDQAGACSVLTVRLEVGADSCVARHALEFCFDVCAEGTALQGARLDIISVEGEVLRIRDVEVV